MRGMGIEHATPRLVVASSIVFGTGGLVGFKALSFGGIGVFFCCFGRTIDGFPWLTWFKIIYEGNPSISILKGHLCLAS